MDVTSPPSGARSSSMDAARKSSWLMEDSFISPSGTRSSSRDAAPPTSGARASSAEVQGHMAAFGELALEAPERTVLAALDALAIAAKDRATATFVTRALNAVRRLAESSTKDSLLEAASAVSDTMVLVEALDNPATLAMLGKEDPVAEARFHGLRAQHRLVNVEGGVRSAQQLGALLHLSRQAVDKRRKAGKLIALDLGRHGYGYPVWQVDNGSVLPGLDRVIAELSECDSWTQVAFMLSPNPWLGEETPLAALRRGEVERVLATAEMFDY